jgi:hypothetical protein
MRHCSVYTRKPFHGGLHIVRLSPKLVVYCAPRAGDDEVLRLGPVPKS